jgi:hypothetical protein
MLSGSEAILMVEGQSDKDYMEMLRGPEHGSHRLSLTGEIVPYDGTGSLQNTVLLRFIKNRYRKLFVTFDLDAASQVERHLQALELQKGKQYLPIGLAAAGKRNIEGLLPDHVTSAVYAANPGVALRAHRHRSLHFGWHTEAERAVPFRCARRKREQNDAGQVSADHPAASHRARA